MKHSSSKPTNRLSVFILILLSIGLLLPALLNWDQFALDNTRGHWFSSIAILIIAGIAVFFTRKRGWVELPPWGNLLGLIALAAVSTVAACPFSFISPNMVVYSIFILTALFCLSWLLLRRYCLILLLPFLFIGMIEVGAYLQYRATINSMVLIEAIECSKEELLVYINLTNILLLVAGIVFLAAIGLLLFRIFRSQSTKATISTCIILVLLTSIFYPTVPTGCTSPSRISLPGTFKRIRKAIRDLKKEGSREAQALEALPSPADKPHTLPTLQGNEGLVIIMHMGESARADRMGFNGFERDTTPNLSRDPRLITWKQCISSAGATAPSLPVILTNARRAIKAQDNMDGSMDATCGSVMGLFKASGFAMHSFLGALSRQSIRMDRVQRLLIKDSDEKHYTDGDVMMSVEQIKECLKNTGSQNLFILINNEGSHAAFYMYDQKNPPFTPSMHTFKAAAAHADSVRNAYDNTLHYTDRFVHDILKALEGRPFAYVYVSDHGEYLGDYDGTWGRGRVGSTPGFFHSTQASAVAAFAICSEEFKKLHPHFRQAADQLARSTGITIGHEHFFHTLLGLVGMQTPYYEATLDLCSPEVKPYSGPKPNDWPKHLLLGKP